MIESIIGENALEDAMRKCVRGVSYKSSVAYFKLNSVDTIPQLHEELANGTYKARKPKRFVVKYPKVRNIVSISFRDRVFQRSLNDNAVYPKMTKSFIYDNMACQKGKGTDLARARMKYFMQDFWHKNGTQGYVLKTDIKKYYDNIPHDKAKEIFAKHLDGWELEQVYHVLDHQYPKEIGFEAGSQMIQILGISAPNQKDHYHKEKLHLKYYMRYQDDTIIIHKDKSVLINALEEEKRLLGMLGLKINVKKTKIVKLTDGFEFLGFVYRLTPKGKVIMSVSPKRVKQEYRHLRNMVRKSKKGELPKYKVDEHLKSVIMHYRKGNSEKLIERITKFYKELWREK